MEKMKAIAYKRYGRPEVLELVEVEKPSPKAHEVLVKIQATTVTTTECYFRQGKPLTTRLFTGLVKPKINRLGEELAGEIEAVGQDVQRFKKGDLVFGTAGPEFGANAEYICLPEDGVLAPKPAGISPEKAAASVDGFLTALPFLRDTGKIKQGQRVLIYGASGSVGSSAVQLAKYFGTEVTAVCSSTNIELVKSLGADKAIDYSVEDFTQNGETYDIILDAVGKIRFPQVKKVLTPNGVFLEVAIGLSVLPNVLWTSLIGKQKVKIAATGLRPPKERAKDLLLLKELLETGQVKPVIDRTYALEQIAQAHTYVDQGHKKGNVAIVV
ncbi:NAD(P)-dependent alcohol dehydrogenase [Sunxiuqinia sp. sy24]|uniref:NAD(P)-dependent alcohol dehydrogenase n=1 Tax=Sunxiuqinia sp. sy24 TaxID=3461495 RepID=UPI004045FF3C